MRGAPRKDVVGTFVRGEGAASAGCQITIAAVEGYTHVLDFVHWSLSLPTDAKETLAITIGGSLTYEIDIPDGTLDLTASIPYMPRGQIDFHRGLYGGENEAIVVTLSGNSAGALVANLNVGYH